MKAREKKRRKCIFRVLLAVLLLMVPGLSVLLYGPVKTPASLEKVADFLLFVMRYQGIYLFDNTVSSVFYNLSKGRIQPAIGKDYTRVYNFKLQMKSN